MGADFRVSRQRGMVMQSPFGVPILATVHPSSILRALDETSREAAMESFITDLRVAARRADPY
jgi:DNA polymerase